MHRQNRPPARARMSPAESIPKGDRNMLLRAGLAVAAVAAAGLGAAVSAG